MLCTDGWSSVVIDAQLFIVRVRTTGLCLAARFFSFLLLPAVRELKSTAVASAGHMPVFGRFDIFRTIATNDCSSTP